MGPCELRDSLNFVIHLELLREEGEERNEASPIGERLRVRRPVFSSFFLCLRSLVSSRRKNSMCASSSSSSLSFSLAATRCVKLLFTQRTATC